MKNIFENTRTRTFVIIFSTAIVLGAGIIALAMSP